MRSADMQLLLLWLLYGLPLLAAVGCVVVGRRVKRGWRRVVFTGFGWAALLPSTWLFLVASSYLWALHLESRWAPARPQSRAEMEAFLSLYSTRTIEPRDSLWGNGHVLGDGERMLQYRILWDSPLGVVYDRDDRIVAIYTSYE